MQITDITNFLGITNTKSKEPEPSAKPVFDPEKEGERKVLHRWETYSRTQKKIDKKLLKTLLVISVVVFLLLIVVKEFWLILVVVSILFLYYMLTVTSPDRVTHEILNHGVIFAGEYYSWVDLKNYFFAVRDSTEVLCINTVEPLPGRLYFLVNPGEKEKVKEIVGRYLPFLEEEPKTFIDKMYDSASKRLMIKS